MTVKFILASIFLGSQSRSSTSITDQQWYLVSLGFILPIPKKISCSRSIDLKTSLYKAVTPSSLV